MNWPSWLPQIDPGTGKALVVSLATIALHEFLQHPKGRTALKRVIPSVLWFLGVFSFVVDGVRLAMLQSGSPNAQNDAAIAAAVEKVTSDFEARLKTLEETQKAITKAVP